MDSEQQAVAEAKNTSFMARFGRRNVILLTSVVVVLAVIATLTSQVISWNEADDRLVHQSAFTGNLTVINQAGPYLKAFGTTSAYKKVISINFTGDSSATASAIVPLIPIRFLDTTTGGARGVSRFRLPGNVPASESGALRGLLKIHD